MTGRGNKIGNAHLNWAPDDDQRYRPARGLAIDLRNWHRHESLSVGQTLQQVVVPVSRHQQNPLFLGMLRAVLFFLHIDISKIDIAPVVRKKAGSNPIQVSRRDWYDDALVIFNPWVYDIIRIVSE